MGWGTADCIELLNKQISRVMLNSFSDQILFITSNGEQFLYQTEGDCCSTTWIEEINGLDNLLGQVIHDVEDVPMGEPEADRAHGQDGSKYFDVLQDYGVKFTTTRGYCDLVYRNESNGYYGGSLGFVGHDADLSKFVDAKDTGV